MLDITLLRGDGIGPEVVDATVIALEATGLKFNWERFELGAATNGTLPDEVLESVRRNRLALKGPTGTPVGTGHKSLNVRLRQELVLYANVRPVLSVPGVTTRYSNVDLIIYRENVGGHYGGKERVEGDVAIGESIYTLGDCERFARYAYRDAIRRGRRKMTVVHKANVLKETHGMFRRVALEVAKEFPEIETNELITDNFFHHLITNPNRLDCLLMTNLDGDYASDAAAALVGGLGVAPGANIGDKAAVFEAVHGTAPDIAGQGRANPTSLMLSGAMLLDHIGKPAEAGLLRRSLFGVIATGACVTADINPAVAATTAQFTDAVVRRMERLRA